MKHVFIGCLALLLFSCSPSTVEEKAERVDWNTYLDNYITQYLEIYPHVAVYKGLHDYDGQLMDVSPEGILRAIEFFHEQQQVLYQIDTTWLSREEQFEREYLLSEVEEKLFWLDELEWPSRNPSFYRSVLSPSVYLSREYAPLETRLAAFIRYLENLPAAIEGMKQNMGNSELPPTYISLAKGFFNGMVEYFRDDVPTIFEPVENDSLLQKYTLANENALTALEDAASFFEAKEPAGTYVLGEETYQRMLAVTSQVKIDLLELRALAEADLERNLQTLKEACDQYAPGATVPECVARVEREKPAQGPVQAARDQLQGLKNFVIENNIVSIPGDEECLVNEAPPYRRSNSAYIQIPGPFEENLPSIYYIAPPDPSWSEEQQAAYIFSEANLLYTSVHEVWPGHFLQYLHANRSPYRVGRMFSKYVYTEGWAHYTEEMMYNQGLYPDRVDLHIGQLLNALLRNVRFVSSIGLHTGEMTVADSERLFMEKGFQDPGNAEQQAARGTYDPNYLNYTLGKLIILKLRKDWFAEHGEGTSLQAFHDQLLSYGGPPLPLVRRYMLKQDDKKLFLD